jgi:hypothetical protein
MELLTPSLHPFLPYISFGNNALGIIGEKAITINFVNLSIIDSMSHEFRPGTLGVS